MIEGRVIGLDPGERRIGVALSDPAAVIAQPHTVIDRRDGKPMDAIRAIVEQFDVETIVIGLPVSLSGDEGAAAEAARAFGGEVQSAIGRNLFYWDERFTSVQAEQALLESGMRRDRRRTTRDMVAAALMLQGFLDAHASREQ